MSVKLIPEVEVQYKQLLASIRKTREYMCQGACGARLVRTDEDSFLGFPKKVIAEKEGEKSKLVCRNCWYQELADALQRDLLPPSALFGHVAT